MHPREAWQIIETTCNATNAFATVSKVENVEIDKNNLQSFHKAWIFKNLQNILKSSHQITFMI